MPGFRRCSPCAPLNQALAGALGCTLLTWDAPSRLRYMEIRLGADTPAFHTPRAAIDADPRDDRDKFFATPGHLAAQCTLTAARAGTDAGIAPQTT